MKLNLKSGLSDDISVLDVTDSDRIDMIAKKLSKKLKVKYGNIGFLYKNQILFNDKFVRDYQIGNDDIVVYFQYENCARYSISDSVDDRLRELNIINNGNNNDDCINVHIKNLYSNKLYRFDLPQRSYVAHLKRMIANKFNVQHYELMELQSRGDILSDEKTLEYYDIDSGSMIMFIMKLLGGPPWYPNLSILPLTAGCDQLELHNVTNIDQIINEIHNKYNIDKINTRLYRNADKTESIININDINICSRKVYYSIELGINKYEICNKLGAGSFGISFQCKEKSSNQSYALKQFQISKENNSKINVEKQLECFLAMEKHPRIVEIIKQINDIDSSYLLMEYIDRGSIGSIIKKNGALPEKEAAKYALHILEGLEYLHIHRIIHGNIKGSNILIDGNDNAKLSDFGLRTIFHKTSNRNSINEILQSEIGAINWLSPEMIRSGQLVPASDIWSFGAVMVEMITGQIPHYGLSVGQIVFAIMKGQIQFTCPGFYKEHVKAFISICLKAEPRERANFDDLYEHSFLK